MEQEGILAFRQYVEALGKLHSVREYMEKQTGINVLQVYPEIHVADLQTMKAIAKEYKRKIIYASTKNEDQLYKYYASFQIRSKEHGILLTVFCYTDTDEESAS
jgi:hypothetical protein